MPRQVNRCCEPKVLSYDLVPMSGALVLRADGQPIALVDGVLAPLSAAPALGPSVESGTASGSMLPTGLAAAYAKPAPTLEENSEKKISSFSLSFSEPATSEFFLKSPS